MNKRLLLFAVLLFVASLLLIAQQQPPVETPAKATPAETNVADGAAKPTWKCQFGWNPISFNCFPSETIDPTSDAQQELIKQQSALIDSIQAKEVEVEQKELALDRRQNELRDLEQRIERKLDEIKKIQREIEATRIKKSKEDAQDLASLIKLYETMEAESGAEIMNEMDRQTAANIILRMNPRKAAALMQNMQSAVAKELSEMIAHIKANRELSQNL